MRAETNGNGGVSTGEFIETPEALLQWVERACSEGMNGARMVVLISFDGNGRAWAGRSFLQNIVNIDRR